MFHLYISEGDTGQDVRIPFVNLPSRPASPPSRSTGRLFTLTSLPQPDPPPPYRTSTPSGPVIEVYRPETKEEVVLTSRRGLNSAPTLPVLNEVR